MDIKTKKIIAIIVADNRPVPTNSKWLENENNNQMNGHMTWRSSVLKMFAK